MGIDAKTDLHSRMQAQGITPQTIEAAKKFHPHLKKHMPEIVDRLAKHMMTVDGLKDVMATPVKNGDFQKTISAHWLSLFSGKIDEDYYNNAVSVGRNQSKQGFRPRWLMGNYSYLASDICAVAVKVYGLRKKALTEALNAINSLIYLDLNIRLAVYFSLAEEAAVEKRNEAVLELEQVFEASVQGQVEIITNEAAAINPEAKAMASIADQVSSQSDHAASATHEISNNISQVSTSINELASSIGEIGNAVHQSASIARNAVETAQQTDSDVAELHEATVKIGEIVKLITEIADQTNLLALNATIESARAGEAGKGFAVVAGEVKNLAGQTAKATQDISDQVNAIRTAAEKSVNAITEISQTVEEINDQSAAIAVAVEEQTMATDTIMQTINTAVSHADSVMNDITAMQNVASKTQETSDQLYGRARNLSDAAGNLDKSAKAFMKELTKSD
ncbi:methyl-accepting chemotaxis protein [Curvivirga sp.]|uniref:methyl-accepting chemotaxis protein n=1 Tax=Curvivirga sp. TaxID=2856848 RepID=UPI003B5B848D